MRVYPFIFNTVLRRIDPERAHYLALPFVKASRFGGPLARGLNAPDPQLRVKAMGLTFPSPFGIAAGFDKNAEAILGLSALGFGHVEVGTVTRRAQAGNPSPRLFRLIEDRAIVNRMGFNNKGVEAAVARIEAARLARHRPVIGVNIGKNRDTAVEDAAKDYIHITQRLAPITDYIAVNVSSPNTPGLRGLQEISSLRPLLQAVRGAAGTTPLLVKVAPDMDGDQLDGIVALSLETGLDGIIAVNTTVSREGLRASAAEIERIGAGGLSGAPLKERSLEALRRIRRSAPEEFCVISVGGVDTAADVLERLQAGATLVQGYSAFIYEGPLWAGSINRGLVKAGYRGSAAR